MELIIFGAFLIICLVCYIVSRVRAGKELMVLTGNKWDLAFLIGCSIFTLVFLIASNFTKELSTVQYIIGGIAIECLIGTIIFSIVLNKGSIGNMLLSIGAKLFMIWFAILVVILLVIAFLINLIVRLISGPEGEGDKGSNYILRKYDSFWKKFVGHKVAE